MSHAKYTSLQSNSQQEQTVITPQRKRVIYREYKINPNVHELIMRLCVVLLLIPCFTYPSSGLNCTSSNKELLSRSRRHLDFLKQTRVFFRANIKENIFTWGSIWAHAVGFKANMNILNEDKRLRPYRRDTYEVLQELLDMHGLDGQACLLRAFCAARRSTDHESRNGILFKLLAHVFKLDEDDKRNFPHLKEENCDQIFHHHCPLSFNNLSPYTDDI